MSDQDVMQDYQYEESSSGGGLKLELSNFEGPLDLLLFLVKESKIEIKDIFLSQVTEQFLQYMSQLATVDVDQASEYMAIAATLLEIKSRALLPIEPIDDEDLEEKQLNLIRQVEEYEQFKKIVKELKGQEMVNRFYREPEKSVGQEVTVVKENLSFEGLMQAFNKFLMRMQIKSQAENVSRAITKETWTVAQKIEFLREKLEEVESLKFFDLFDEYSSRLEIITTFSAMLELLKLQYIRVQQNGLFEDITIVRRKDAVLQEVNYSEELE